MPDLKDNGKSHGARNYVYQLTEAPEIGEGVVHVEILDGKHKGKVALVIKMPDDFSDFFPKIGNRPYDEPIDKGFFKRLFGGHNKVLQRTR